MLLFKGKATELLEWFKDQMSVYKDCTVAEFIDDSKRHEQAIKAISEAETA